MGKIIVRFVGGLGNQMFQYCLFKKLEQNNTVLVDVQDYSKSIMHQGFELERVFNLKVPKCSKKEKERISNSGSSIFIKVKRRIMGRKPNEIIEREGFLCEHIFSLNLDEDYYLDGYWQDLRYFEEEHKVKDYFKFRELDSRNKKICGQIKNHNSISIHIRRGDYVKNSLYEGICTLDYYKKAIDYIKKRVEEPHFYVFSNDIRWSRENIGLKENEVDYIDWNVDVDSYKDMQLMSYCKHNIIANSSFSWWGAFLNRNSKKIVISPKIWNNLRSEESSNMLIRDEWIKIDRNGDVER